MHSRSTTRSAWLAQMIALFPRIKTFLQYGNYPYAYRRVNGRRAEPTMSDDEFMNDAGGDDEEYDFVCDMPAHIIEIRYYS